MTFLVCFLLIASKAHARSFWIQTDVGDTIMLDFEGEVSILFKKTFQQFKLNFKTGTLSFESSTLGRSCSWTKMSMETFKELLEKQFEMTMNTDFIRDISGVPDPGLSNLKSLSDFIDPTSLLDGLSRFLPSSESTLQCHDKPSKGFVKPKNGLLSRCSQQEVIFVTTVLAVVISSMLVLLIIGFLLYKRSLSNTTFLPH